MGLRTQRRRRKEGKTDYKLRLILLKSGKPRIVVRRTNKYVIVQLVEGHEAKDKIVKCVCSKDLLKHGWDKKFEGSLKNLPACYLTGLMFGKKIKEGNYILDLGMQRTIPGNRLYAVVKGLVDAGVKLKVNEKVFPDEKRLSGEHLKPEVKEMIEKVKVKLGGERLAPDKNRDNITGVEGEEEKK